MSKKPTLAFMEESLRPLAVPVGDVSEDPANVRKHDERSIEAIKASLRRFGQQKPIVVDEQGSVVAGSGTLRAAREIGWSHVAVVRTKLVGPDRTAYGIADNRIAELSDFDLTGLVQQLKELEEYVEDGSLGLTEAEMNSFAQQLKLEEDISDFPDDDGEGEGGDDQAGEGDPSGDGEGDGNAGPADDGAGTLMIVGPEADVKKIRRWLNDTKEQGGHETLCAALLSIVPETVEA